MITREELLLAFRYDPESGDLFWNNGDVAKTISNGYRAVKYRGTQYRVHRIAWLMYYGNLPSGHIDHINCNRLDNRISNIRACSCSENLMNVRIGRKNTSGVKGVTLHRRLNKWQAQLMAAGKSMYLGVFETIQEAENAVKTARQLHHGKFANNG